MTVGLNGGAQSTFFGARWNILFQRVYFLEYFRQFKLLSDYLKFSNMFFLYWQIPMLYNHLYLVLLSYHVFQIPPHDGHPCHSLTVRHYQALYGTFTHKFLPILGTREWGISGKPNIPLKILLNYSILPMLGVDFFKNLPSLSDLL